MTVSPKGNPQYKFFQAFLHYSIKYAYLSNTLKNKVIVAQVILKID